MRLSDPTREQGLEPQISDPEVGVRLLSPKSPNRLFATHLHGSSKPRQWFVILADRHPLSRLRFAGGIVARPTSRFAKQNCGVPQVREIKPLGEPPIHFGQAVARLRQFRWTALPLPLACILETKKTQEDDRVADDV